MKLGVFLIFLVVTMPVFSASAYASFIRDAHVYGDDSVIDYRRKTDTTYATAEVKTDDDVSIGPEQVFFGSNEFVSCEDIGRGVFFCTYASDSKSTIAVKKQGFAIRLVDDNGTEVKTASSSFYVDDLAPEVKSFAISPNPAGDVNVSLTYSVQDYSYSTSDTSHCTGIASVVVRGATEKSIPVSAAGCSYSGSLDMLATELASKSGKTQVCLSALDRFGLNSTPFCIDFTADLEPSAVESVEFFNDYSQLIAWVSEQGTSGRMVVNVTETGTGVESVAGDLSALNKAYTKDRKAVCRKKGRIYSCTFSDLLIKMDNAENTEIALNIKDSAGNTENYSFGLQIRIDNTSPFVNYASSGIESNNTKYLTAKNNTIIAAITESDSGLGNITLDVSGRRYYMNCSAGSCIAAGIDMNAADGTRVIARIFGSDIVGNEIAGNISTPFIVDSDAPNAASIEVNATGEFTLYNLTGIVVGDMLDIYLDVNDATSSSVFVSGDFSDIASSAANSSALCGRNQTWKCRFLGIGPVDRDGNRTILLYLSDSAGNKAEYSHPISIYGRANETNRDDYDVNIKLQSPDRIDRQTTSLTNQRVYVRLELVKKSDVEPLNIIVQSCDENDTLYFAASVPEITLMPADKEHPWLKYVLASAPIPMNVSPLNITCTLRITSLYDKRMIVVENQSFDVSVQLYNLPMGELGSSVYDEIQRIKDGKIVGAQWIEDGRKIMHYSDMMCNMVTIYYTLSIVYSGITDVLNCLKGTPAQAAGVATGTIAATNTKVVAALWQGLRIFCAYNSCNYGEMFGTIFNAKEPWTEFAAFGDKALSMKNSLIVSSYLACYPGIIYNLQKAREIECQYMYCLSSYVSQGLSPAFCQAQRGYEMCKFVVHEKFASIPFMSLVDELSRDMATMIKKPQTMINVALGAVCMFTCTGGGCGLCTVCTVQQVINGIMDIYNMIANKQNWQLSDSICDKVDESLNTPEFSQNEAQDREQLDI